MVLGKIPLVTFLVSCLLAYLVIARRKKEMKSVIALSFFLSIGGFALTIKNLNNKYFSLAKPIIILLDVIIFTNAIVGIIFAIYNVMKEPYGKLPKL